MAARANGGERQGSGGGETGSGEADHVSADFQRVLDTEESADPEGGVAAPNLDGLARGMTIGRYLVVERIGAGAMGIVYSAYDPELDRKIALKLLRTQQTEGDQQRRQARMVREAKAIAKVSHPNVVGIFDVGVHDGQVFMAMEYLAGGTLRDWMAPAKKRSWREIVKLFIQIGHGLSGAHAEGLIHRDFKPDNVLLDKNGTPKVVDFGLVRLSAASELSESGPVDEASPGSASPIPIRSEATSAAALTRTGALTGTPAYMAPEQFAGEKVDERTDQFAFCVALFEALYGERPFAGKNVIALAESVINERIRALPKNAEVPTWVRNCVLRGLRANPDQRHLNFETLLAALSNDPAIRRRRGAIGLVTSILVIGSFVFVRHLVVDKRRQLELQVSDHVNAASASLREAATKDADAGSQREKAFAAFDNFEQSRGEEFWERSLRLTAEATAAHQRGIQRLEAATALIPSHELRAQTADAIARYLAGRELPAFEWSATIRHLATYDDGGHRVRRLTAPAHLEIETVPPGLNARLEKYDPQSYRPIESAKPVGRAPLTLDLAPGSYRLIFDGTDTHVGFSYPVVLAAGERFHASVPAPATFAVPNGFIYVPEGRFLFGSTKEDIRVFLATTPQREDRTGAFLISKYETTIQEWIEFLEALPAAQRELRRPQGRKDGLGGIIDLRKATSGRWELQFRATNVTYHVKESEPFKYNDRRERASQDWSRFPVTGISPQDAMEYAAWLARSGRVRNARLCTEREWERAARGADARDFPHGNRLSPDDANLDVTYGRKDGAYGPDEVGSHPNSISPFGVFDLAGNVWDITTSVLERGQFVNRGASFYQGQVSLLSTNRDPLGAATRDHTVGVRICADVDF